MSTPAIPKEPLPTFGLDDAVDIARSQFYSFLSMSFGDPALEEFSAVFDGNNQQVALAAADLLASEVAERVELAPGERPPEQLDLRAVIQGLAMPRNELVSIHQKVFGLVLSKECPPNETEYCPSDLTFRRTQELADIAGFYEAFKVRPSRSCHERQDHISLELAFMAYLISKERIAAASDNAALREKASLCRQAQRDFLQAHLAWWVPAFAHLLRRRAAGGLYAALADALACLIPFERWLLNVPPPQLIPKPQFAAEPPEGEYQSCS